MLLRVFGFGAVALAAFCGAACAYAQQRAPIGTLPTSDALVNGQVEVAGSKASLISNVSVTVYDHSTPVTLGRGGELLACSTSEFHLLRPGPGESLVVGLDRGALELRSATQSGDIVMTPDLKFTPVTKGQYDLRLRVTREGDTCVQNEGTNAPVLNVTDAFTSYSYRVLPGQHVLFVKGDLHSVVDHERSPCGCPAAPRALAQNGKPQTAADAHPFPEAQSQGLAPTALPGNAEPGTTGSQVTTTMSYSGGETAAPEAASPNLGGNAGPPALPPAEEPHGFFHSIGHFFHKLFHPSK